MIAEGIIGAVKEVGVNVPVVVRLEGTNADKGLKLLKERGLNVEPVQGFANAAERIVSLVKEEVSV
jgi:succinyl-CoA synthetase beta subunit